MENQIATINEESKVTEKLLMDYLSTLNEKLDTKQLTQFLAVSKEFNLNPFKREIYAVKYGSNFNIIVGYEVYLKRAELCPQYDGYETTFGKGDGDTFCKCSVYRKDRQHPITSIVWMKEYNTGKSLWSSKPNCMLEKVAICTAFRRAFPSEYGGLPYTADELGGAEKLNAQGYTEVVMDEQQTTQKPSAPKNPIEEFKLTLKGYEMCNPANFELLKNWMKNMGWDRPSAVGVNDYQVVYSKWNELQNENKEVA